MVQIAIEGPAVLAGIGNGNPLSLDPFQDAQHPLFSGKAASILRSVDGEPGSIRITASAQGLDSEERVVQTTHAGT